MRCGQRGFAIFLSESSKAVEAISSLGPHLSATWSALSRCQVSARAEINAMAARQRQAEPQNVALCVQREGLRNALDSNTCLAEASDMVSTTPAAPMPKSSY